MMIGDICETQNELGINFQSIAALDIRYSFFEMRRYAVASSLVAFAVLGLGHLPRSTTQALEISVTFLQSESQLSANLISKNREINVEHCKIF
jgi:hypothetical protein